MSTTDGHDTGSAESSVNDDDDEYSSSYEDCDVADEVGTDDGVPAADISLPVRSRNVPVRLRVIDEDVTVRTGATGAEALGSPTSQGTAAAVHVPMRQRSRGGLQTGDVAGLRTEAENGIPNGTRVNDTSTRYS